MVHIKDWVKSKEESGMKQRDIALDLPVSHTMVGQYKNRGFLPSLQVAIAIYKNEGIVLHPYSEESIKYETKLGAR